SSQYISALLLTSPYSQGDTTIQIEGQLVSRGYVELTMRLMADFGVKSHWLERNSLLIPANQSYQSRDFEVEGDASSASYFLAMAAITGGEILIKGISKDTSQSDFGLIDILDEMGCEIAWEKEGVRLIGGKLKGIEVDMNSMSDVAQTLAVVALFAEGKTRIRNVANMRIKECDRISAMVAELGKLNAQVEEFPDGLSVQGMGNYHGASLKTYDDHRMAMSLSLAGLKIPSVKILDPSCVSKTFPEFFDYFLPLVQPLS
ncbi:MAG: 3-phosphoshikimate 1-carboxyvinyltransferase, partial [Deltaproteobacteria bacterium]|nr:3-phosphoshikimate 1-carboxyvinyltransferase [Deltaproteobacteria bacterium]